MGTLTEKFTLDFVISDENLNRNGYRIMTDGIQYANFQLNPVAYFNHQTSEPSIGKWSRLWKEDGKLKGTLEFDADDEFAMRLYHKYKNDYMRAVSLNVVPIEESSDTNYLLAGQKYPTLVKSELIEVSLVSIPGNSNAVKLIYNDGTEYKLSLISNSNQMAKEEKTVEQLREDLRKSLELNVENLIALHKQRGVITDVEVPSLKKLAIVDYETVKLMLESREKKEDKNNELAKQLVKLHLDRGAISEMEREFFEQSAESDYEATKKVLELRKGKEAISDFLNGMQNNGQGRNDEREKWTYLDYYKKDFAALEEMKEKQPDKFKQLEADFLNESKKMGITTEE